jgi:hypothetical protein
VLLLDSDQTSSYNALQVTGDLRPWHHLSLNGFYTLSKTMSSAELHNTTTQGLAQNYSNLGEEHGPADTDQRHVFSMSVNWEIKGWSFSPIIKLRSGVPFTVTNGNVDANLDGNTNDRANLVGDPKVAQPTTAQWFNTAAFAQNPVIAGVATDGSSGRNMFYGPKYHNIDMAVSRSIPMKRRATLRLRIEGTNLFNIVSLGQPGLSVPAAGATSATFGVIRSAYQMRKLQLGLRLTF